MAVPINLDQDAPDERARPPETGWAYERFVIGGGTLLAVLLLWEAFGRSGLIDPLFISSPTRVAQAGFGLVPEPGQGGPEERGEVPGGSLEGELSGVGHLGPGAGRADGHGVDGDYGRVLAAQPDPLAGHQLLYHVAQLALAAQELRGVLAMVGYDPGGLPYR